MGRYESCVYIVNGGKESVLIGGGMSYIVPDMLRQVESFSIDEESIKRMIILHSHFDHCGAIAFLKKRWPWARITASMSAKKLLSTSEISERIAEMNRAAIEKNGLEEEATRMGFSFTGMDVEETVGEGDVLSCGDITLEVIKVPGHSSCSIALYMPHEKALFASDAAGIRYKNVFRSSANSNYGSLLQNALRAGRLFICHRNG